MFFKLLFYPHRFLKLFYFCVALFSFTMPSSSQVYVPQRRTYKQLDANGIGNSFAIMQAQRNEAYKLFNSALSAANDAIAMQEYNQAILYLKQCIKINEDYEFIPNTDLINSIEICKKKEAEHEAISNLIKNPDLNKQVVLSGTGFAIENGFIVTNYHVIEDAKTIEVYGINGKFESHLSATVKVLDRINDIAILQTSTEINGFGTLPYRIKTSTSDVGEDIFVLGYPLTTTMGDEIKLTNGIISSLSGFQGDNTQYQISAPIQPGNSGGPLFDKRGNVIGIICAKHKDAENVGYAIKTPYLQALIEKLDSKEIKNTKNTITNLPLSNQVKAVKKYIYFIKCTK